MAIEGNSASGRGLDLHRLQESAARARARLAEAVGRLPPKARFALFLGLVALVLIAISVVLSLPSATIRLVCRHDLRSADMTVSIDGTIVHMGTVTGASRKWFGVLEKTEGSYSAILPVSSGRHTVLVRLRAPGYDRSRSIQGDFSRGQESILSIDAGRDLALAWRDPGGASAPEPASGSSSWLKYAGSILLTIFGSIVSASIGVFVQDFLRSRKAARLAEESATQPPSSKSGS